MLKKCRYIPTLETDRLILRELTPEDTGDLKEWLAKEELYTYWGRKATEDELNPDLLFVDPNPGVKHRLSTDIIWWIEDKSTHRVVGEIEVYDIRDGRIGMVGYRIAPEMWNTGICSESMRCVIDYIFSRTKMDRLQGFVDVRNTASNRVFEKCGFTHEGTVRHGKMVSVYCDYHIWGLLREDLGANGESEGTKEQC